MIDGFDIGDAVEMKKPHACGGSTWQITRTGADIAEMLPMRPRCDDGQAGFFEAGKAHSCARR